MISGAREYQSVQSNSDPLWGSSQAILEWATTSVVSLGQIFTKPVCQPSIIIPPTVILRSP